jgi:hypothetical protein
VTTSVVSFQGDLSRHYVWLNIHTLMGMVKRCEERYRAFLKLKLIPRSSANPRERFRNSRGHLHSLRGQVQASAKIGENTTNQLDIQSALGELECIDDKHVAVRYNYS